MPKIKPYQKVATGEAKPNGKLFVEYGTEKEFLAPLSVRRIPMVGLQFYNHLREMGIDKIHTVQQMPAELLERVFGIHGRNLWFKAQGIDNSPIVPYFERQSLSMERTFGRDTTDVKHLKKVITSMSEGLAYQLRQGSKLASCLTVKIRYSDFQTFSKQSRIPYTSLDHAIIKHALDLFDKLYTRRMLVRLIGLKCSHLAGGHYQLNLLEDAEETIRLYQAMDKIRNKYGNSRVIMRASTMDVPNMGVFGNPFNGEPPVIPAHRTV